MQKKPALSRASTQFKMRDYGSEISQALKAPPRGDSQSFRLHPGEVKAQLMALGLGFKDDGEQVQVEWCPLCPKPHNNQRTNMYTLGIKQETGAFNCFRCQ